jgi:hypothetical protein
MATFETSRKSYPNDPTGGLRFNRRQLSPPGRNSTSIAVNTFWSWHRVFRNRQSRYWTMPHPLRELSGTAGAPGEAATSSRPRGSPHAPFNEILETTALVLADETITVEPCKALIRELVNFVITMEERLSRTEKKLDDVVKHISNPETYTTGTTVAAAAAAMPTTPGSPHKMPPLSPKTMMIEMMENQREEQRRALDQIQDCSEEGTSW